MLIQIYSARKMLDPIRYTSFKVFLFQVFFDEKQNYCAIIMGEGRWVLVVIFL